MMAGPDAFWIYNYRISLFLCQDWNSRFLPVLGQMTPPPLVEAIAEVVKVMLVIKRDNVIAESMKNTCIWRH